MNFIPHDELYTWLEAIWQDKVKIFAPRLIENTLLYRPVDNPSQILLTNERPVLSLKELFFPPTERLFTYEANHASLELTPTYHNEGQVVFGVRPCDARAVSILDRVFLKKNPQDAYYAARRENTTLVGVACAEMAETCFCTTMGSSPDDSQFVDVMLKAIDGGYQVEVVTPKGEKLISKYGLQLEIKTYWNELAERCLSCRICAYVCPTCRCFDVRDEPLPSVVNGKHYERIRCWDSCTGEGYRRVAGGHNPRSAKGERLRNRFFCKFYYFPQQYGPEACVGCGRCIDACPVNIDITEVMGHITEVAA